MFQSSLLQNELISSQAVIRTIRSSSTLEDAKQAWSRFLNLPGRGGTTQGTSDYTISDTPSVTIRAMGKRLVIKPAFTPTVTRFYTHQELWDRDDMAKSTGSTRQDAVESKGHKIGNGRCLQSFVA